MNEFNSMAFTRENVEAGLHNDLLKYLVNYHSNDDDRYCDIHITSDGECLIIEWVLVPYDHSYGGKFEFVDEECEVMREIEFPDEHFEFIYPDVDPQDVIKDWVEDHPGWYRNKYGRWYFDAEKLKEEQEKNKKDGE